MNEIKIHKIKISKIKPLRTHLLNLNGNISASGFYGKKKVKIYSPVEKSQIRLRYEISKSKLGKYFPKLICYDKKFIVEEWINGKTLKELNYQSKKKKTFIEKKIFSIINDLKRFKPQKTRHSFDYIAYIYKRSGKKKDRLFYDLKKLPTYLNHNDLTLDNIIFQNGRFVIIDNEFLGYNNGWILNIKNSFLRDKISFYENLVSEQHVQKIWKIRKNWKNKMRIRFMKSVYTLKKKIFD